MTALNELHAKYETFQKDLEAAEATAEELKKQKAEVAKQILAEHGSGPHTLGGKVLIVAKARGGTPFLREPPPKKGSKAS